MFQSYIAAAFRNLIKNPIFSIINIGGLALGLAVCMLVYLYAQKELNYDEWVSESSHIYRIEMNYHNNDWGYGYSSNVPAPMKLAFDESFPEIKYSSLFDWSYDPVKRGDNVFYEQIVTVNNDFYNIFPLTFIYGDATTATPNLNTIAISRSIAAKYFGDENPMGQLLTIEGNRPMTVGAVYEDLPENSHMPLDLITLFNFDAAPWIREWNSSSPWLYIYVDDPATLPTIHTKLFGLVDQHQPFTREQDRNATDRFTFFAQPFADIHLKSSGRTENNPYGNLAYLYGYIGIALLILGISCVNYVNLSTARATKRTKEVCIRKVMGAGRRNLLSQFMGETFFLATIALIAAIGLVQLILPWFALIIDDALAFNFADPMMWLMFFGLIAFCGLFAGIYPAIYVSRFRPSKFLHANKSESGTSGRLRNLLVIFQFSGAIALIAAAVIIYSQMRFVNTLDLGFNRDNIVVLRGLNQPLTSNGLDSLRAEISRIPGVESVAGSYNVPGDGRYSGEGLYILGTPSDEGPGARIMPMDPEFLNTYGVPLIAGRYLSRERQGDMLQAMGPHPEDDPLSINVVINRSLAEELGFKEPEEAIGQIAVSTVGRDAHAHMTIVGVSEDFTFGSAKRSVDSLLMFHHPQRLQQMSVRIDPVFKPEILDMIDEVWKRHYPDVPVRRDFLDENLDQSMVRENQQSRLFLGFSALAIILSCLGLLGLAIFTAENRVKEIGVRKVMGASVSNIVGLLTWQFSKPMIAANIIALPLAWLFAQNWLESFSHRIDLSVGYFAVASILTLAIGWLTIASHAFSAARTNPINALRYE